MLVALIAALLGEGAGGLAGNEGAILGAVLDAPAASIVLALGAALPQAVVTPSTTPITTYCHRRSTFLLATTTKTIITFIDLALVAAALPIVALRRSIPQVVLHLHAHLFPFRHIQRAVALDPA